MSKIQNALCIDCLEELPHTEENCPMKQIKSRQESIQAQIKPRRTYRPLVVSRPA